MSFSIHSPCCSRVGNIKQSSGADGEEREAGDCFTGEAGGSINTGSDGCFAC